MIVRKTEICDSVAKRLISMSASWEHENSCYGYRANNLDDFKDEDIFVAEENGQIIAYLFCHSYIQENQTAAVPKGSRCLEVEELYVVPEFRSRGIGKRLWEEAVSCYQEEAEYVTLSTATKNHKAILHFYIDELSLEFWSARLFKKLKH